MQPTAVSATSRFLLRFPSWVSGQRRPATIEAQPYLQADSYESPRVNNDLVFGRSLLDVIDHEDGVRAFGFLQFETQLFGDGVEDGEVAVGIGVVGGISGGGKRLIDGAEAQREIVR